MDRVCLGIAASLFVACTVPRSAVLGQTAAAIGAGRAEVALATGVNAHFESDGSSSTNGITFPVYEGNLQFGLSDQTGVNLHLSPAGLQPGLKFTFASENLAFAVLPEVGLGLITTSTQGTTNGVSAFIGGAKFILSHPTGKGVYGGIGYDFQYFVNSSRGDPFFSPNYRSHAISAALGFDHPVGFLRLRPEVSVIISPSTKASGSNGDITQYYVLPTLTVALQTPSR